MRHNNFGSIVFAIIILQISIISTIFSFQYYYTLRAKNLKKEVILKAQLNAYYGFISITVTQLIIAVIATLFLGSVLNFEQIVVYWVIFFISLLFCFLIQIIISRFIASMCVLINVFYFCFILIRLIELSFPSNENEYEYEEIRIDDLND